MFQMNFHFILKVSELKLGDVETNWIHLNWNKKNFNFSYKTIFIYLKKYDSKVILQKRFKTFSVVFHRLLL